MNSSLSHLNFGTNIIATSLILCVCARYERLNDIKKQNPSVKVLLAAGRGNESAAHYNNMTSSDVTRREFAASTVTFLRQNGFDGIDVDWEYPVDKNVFTALIKVIYTLYLVWAVCFKHLSLYLSAIRSSTCISKQGTTIYHSVKISGLGLEYYLHIFKRC